MRRRFSKLCLLIFSCWLLLGPLALLQLGAWGWMLASYSQESSFQQAFVETFGDERPCELCLVIDAVEETERDLPVQQTPDNDLKLMLGLACAVRIQAPVAAYQPAAIPVGKPEDVSGRVPTPPPRRV
ncbi:MAG: hypothetical protein ACPGGN_05985 [Opitutales bacterium]